VNENDLRDCFAMFAMTGLFMKGIGLDEESAKQCWDAADTMIRIRNNVVRVTIEPEEGIATVKLKRRSKNAYTAS
jgi:hypothetical protein